jgi:anaerobic sulfite reductase subunit A
MGYILTKSATDSFLTTLAERYTLYAPKRFSGGGKFSDTDSIRYGEICGLGDIEFAEKSEGTFREALNPITQTLSYFTESSTREPEPPINDAIIFLRSCDLHAVLRHDNIYLQNGSADYYYERIRKHVKFVLLPCKTAFDSCFCVDMGTNRSENYDMSFELDGDEISIDCKGSELEAFIKPIANMTASVAPSYVTETKTRVSVPDNLTAEVAKSAIWNEYDSRCIACGRCNFSCPTCTCYTMQDIFYTDNGQAGERRRVWASCMVDGFTDVAGGGQSRRKNGERMRFKVLHKVLDHKKRFGCQMCVGCGRCDDVCPEYISFSNIVNKLGAAMEEVSGNE